MIFRHSVDTGQSLLQCVFTCTGTSRHFWLNAVQYLKAIG